MFCKTDASTNRRKKKYFAKAHLSVTNSNEVFPWSDFLGLRALNVLGAVRVRHQPHRLPTVLSELCSEMNKRGF